MKTILIAGAMLLGLAAAVPGFAMAADQGRQDAAAEHGGRQQGRLARAEARNSETNLARAEARNNETNLARAEARGNQENWA